MRVYEASTRISAEFGGIRDLSRHLSLNLKTHDIRTNHLELDIWPSASNTMCRTERRTED